MSITEKVTFNDDGFVIQRWQPIAAILDYAQARHNEGYHGFKDFKFIGPLPVLAIEEYCQKTGVSFREFHKNPEHIKRIMNNPDNSRLRVAPGRM